MGKKALWLAFLPLALIKLTLKNKKQKFRRKLIPLLFIILFLLPVWLVGYLLAGFTLNALAITAAEQVGLSPIQLNIVGTGSMYPTWPKGTAGKTRLELSREIVSTAGFMPYPNGLKLGSKIFFGHRLGRGDIITWENEATHAFTGRDDVEPAGLLKRLIGLPGDTLELRQGIIYLNGQPQKEPYIAKPRSTFGQDFLKECQVVTVPENHVFALGDNRTGSGDSREIGFAPMADIDFVLPLNKQIGRLDNNWHDPTDDLEDTAKIRLDKIKYLELLNEKRTEAGTKPLTYQPKLEKSAGIRGEVILKFDDFSFEATRSGVTMARAMSQAGYSNIVWGEAPTLGYYEAEELIENQFEFPDSRKFLLEKDYQAIGIAEVEGELNGCPTQILVQHFAGYVPPNYDQSDVDSWAEGLANLKEILPSWENVKNSPNLYRERRDETDRILYLINLRISRIGAIVARMQANQWLTSEEKKFIEEDHQLYQEQRALAQKFNSSTW